jgi:uncharacterized protein with FMN-binding domain
MRRVIPVILATAGGAALVASFHTTPEAGGVVAQATPSSTTLEPSTTRPTSRLRPITTTTVATLTLDGSVIQTRFGPVQVRATVRGRSLLDVQAMQLPSAHPRSAEISRQAEPMLREEALSAQSAQINIISGASYTSAGYRESLQAALDRVGM